MGASPEGGTGSSSGSGAADHPDGGAPPGGAGSGSGSGGAGSGGGGGGSGSGSGSGAGSGSGSGAGSGSGSGSGDGDCTFCNAASGADVGRGSTDTNTSGAADRSPCLPDSSLQAFTISNLRPIVGQLLKQLAARTATLELQPAIVAANLAGFVVGIGPAADFGLLHGWSGGGGIYFAPGNVVGFYGSYSEDDGLFAGGDVGLSITVIYGMDNFSGDGYAVGASAEFEIGGSFALTFDSSGQHLTGYCASVGFGFSAGLYAQFSHTYVTPGS